MTDGMSDHYSLPTVLDRVPPVADRMLVELVNGIHVSGDLLRYRRRQGAFGRFIDVVTGKAGQRQLLLDGNLVTGQEALHRWVLDLAKSQHVTHVALMITQRSLLEARDAARTLARRLGDQTRALEDLAKRIDALSDLIASRLGEIDDRLRMFEFVQLCNEIIAAWQVGTTYRGLPWIFQVVLLIREIVSKAVGGEPGDLDRLRAKQIWLANAITLAGRNTPAGNFSLPDLLGKSITTLPGDDFFLACALLEAPPRRRSQLQESPILYFVGTALELSGVPADARPVKPASCAFELALMQVGYLPRILSARTLVELLLIEMMNDVAFSIAAPSGGVEV